MQIRRAKVVLIGFVFFLVALVVMADTGRGGWLFNLAQTIPAGDKVGHVVLFGILSFLANLLAGSRTIQFAMFSVLKWSAILMLLVALEECSQVFFRSRTFDLLDLASDALGIWLFGRLAVAYLNYKRRLT
jgi:VanZ family protein